MSDVVVITGASEGIGRATAFAFAEQKKRLVLAARTSETLKQTAIALEQELDAEVLVVPTDMAVEEQVQHLISQALSRFGQVDVLINNAGICMSGSFRNTTLADWQHLMAVNFWGYIYAIQAVLPQMLERGKGQIINVGSFGGKMPLPQMSAYCASKYAVAGLTESLRLELQPQGIEVIGIHPGVVSSNFLQRAVFVDERTPGGSQPARQQIESALTSLLVNTPEEVAQAILDASLSHKTDVVVGMAQVMTGAYQWFPGLLTPVLQSAGKQA